MPQDDVGQSVSDLLTAFGMSSHPEKISIKIHVTGADDTVRSYSFQKDLKEEPAIPAAAPPPEVPETEQSLPAPEIPKKKKRGRPPGPNKKQEFASAAQDIWAGIHACSPDEACRKLLPFVKMIALSVIRRLPASIELDDLVQDGCLGLMDALSKHNPASGANLKTYASLRIHGAIIDGLRGTSDVARSVKHAKKAIDQIKTEANEKLTPEQIKQALLARGFKREVIFRATTSGSDLRLDDFSEDHDGPDPYNLLGGDEKADPAQIYEKKTVD